MTRPLVWAACLLLLWAQTAPVSCADPEISVSEVPGGIKLSCGSTSTLKKGEAEIDGELKYKDENTGVYTCVTSSSSDEKTNIYVIFRSCDNCIELDNISIAGLVAGDLVLTLVIGVAVYLVTSQTSRISPVTSNKKSSDRQHLVPNEGGSRGSNDHYQPLKARQRDTYDVLTNRK